MISLKAFSAELGPLVGLTEAALYERQRALVRMGMLPEAVKGRGRGLAATPETVATLLIAVMVTDNLSDVDIRVHQLAQMRAKRRCEFTGKFLFADALSAVLASQDLAEKISSIHVFRADLAAQIRFIGAHPTDNKRRETRISQFGRMREFPDRMEVEATLWGPVVDRMQALLQRTQLQAD